MLINQIARRLELFVGKDLPWTVIVEFFLLTIPYLIVMTISMSVLVAVLHTFSRLAHDNEITALRATGISLARLVRPVLIAGSLVAVFAFLFGDQVLPRTNHRLRTLMSAIGRTKPTFSLKEHVVNEVQRGRVFLRAAQIDQASYLMRDVTIYRLTDRRTTQIVYADSGRMSFDSAQTDLHVSLFDGTAHEFDRRDPGMFDRTEYGTYLVKLEGIGNEFVRREGDTYHGDRELGVCALEDVFRREFREETIARRRAETAEKNGIRSLVGLPLIEPDTVVALPRRSLYCTALAALLPEELAARTPPQEDTLSAVQRTQLEAPARRVTTSGLSPRTRSNEARIQHDRAHSSKVRVAVYKVEFHKKYAIPAACIVFVLVGVPVALRFPGGGLGLVLAVGLVIFSVYYTGLIAGESLANRLTVPPFWAMWTPNVVFGMLGVFLLWRTGRKGVGRSRGRARDSIDSGATSARSPA